MAMCGKEAIQKRVLLCVTYISKLLLRSSSPAFIHSIGNRYGISPSYLLIAMETPVTMSGKCLNLKGFPNANRIVHGFVS